MRSLLFVASSLLLAACGGTLEASPDETSSAPKLEVFSPPAHETCGGDARLLFGVANAKAVRSLVVHGPRVFARTTNDALFELDPQGATLVSGDATAVASTKDGVAFGGKTQVTALGSTYPTTAAARGLTVSNNDVFWTEAATDGAFVRRARPGVPPATFAWGPIAAPIAADETHVHWIGVGARGTATINRATLDGEGSFALATLHGEPRALFAEGHGVVALVRTGGVDVLYDVDKSSGRPTVLFQSAGIVDVAVTTDDVFFVHGRTILRADRTTARVSTFHVDRCRPRALAASPNEVHFVSANDGASDGILAAKPIAR